jgi:hypothetical protein
VNNGVPNVCRPFSQAVRTGVLPLSRHKKRPAAARLLSRRWPKAFCESKKQVENSGISKWVGGFESYSDLDVSVSDIVDRLVFGTKARSMLPWLRMVSFATVTPDGGFSNNRLLL